MIDIHCGCISGPDEPKYKSDCIATHVMGAFFRISATAYALSPRRRYGYDYFSSLRCRAFYKDTC